MTVRRCNLRSRPAASEPALPSKAVTPQGPDAGHVTSRRLRVYYGDPARGPRPGKPALPTSANLAFKLHKLAVRAWPTRTVLSRPAALDFKLSTVTRVATHVIVKMTQATEHVNFVYTRGDFFDSAVKALAPRPP